VVLRGKVLPSGEGFAAGDLGRVEKPGPEGH